MYDDFPQVPTRVATGSTGKVSPTLPFVLLQCPFAFSIRTVTLAEVYLAVDVKNEVLNPLAGCWIQTPFAAHTHTGRKAHAGYPNSNWVITLFGTKLRRSSKEAI